ncbi:hypothetical protein C8R48DRAFT_778217 [Suillus tomentosus]|nr:hypothetical protein C8R48DRAFT_778217 [Suillus tomentosus]
MSSNLFKSLRYKSNKPATSASSSASKALDLTSKLGKDGKLTSEERKRQMDNKLCLFCGGASHSAWDCTKSTLCTAKGRAAVVTLEDKPEASDEAKIIVCNPPDSTRGEGCIDSTRAMELHLNTNMSGNTYGSQTTAKQKMLELQQQLADAEAATQMEEEENRKHQEEERKHQEELRKIEQAKIRREGEEKRRREIVAEMTRAMAAEKDGSCTRCAAKRADLSMDIDIVVAGGLTWSLGFQISHIQVLCQL